MNRSPAEIRDRWLNYGRRYARYPTLWDSSLALASGPLAPEAGTLQDYSGRTAGAAWSVGAGDVPKYEQASVRGQAFWAGQYDGSNDKTSAVSTQFQIANNLSVSAWVYKPTLASQYLIGVLSAAPYQNGWYFYTSSTGLMVAGFRNADSNNWLSSAGVFPAATWVHVYLSFASGTVTLRINNVPVALTPPASPAATIGYTTSTLETGIVSGLTAWGGNVASVALRSRLLTPAEIAILATHPLAAYEVEVPRYWTFPLTSTAKPWLYARTSSQIIGGGIA